MTPRNRSLAVVAVVALVTLALAPPVAPAVGAAPGPGADDQLGQQVDPDSVRMTIGLRPDGDARWTVTYRVRLKTDNQTAAFESLMADVEANPENFTDRFAERMRSTARAAERATGREMAIRDVAIDARKQQLVQTYGVLEYTFTWTNFAVVEGDTIRAGDAIGGLFLDGETTLVVRWPAGYGLVEVHPEPSPDVGDNRSVGWAGPEDFQRGEPHVVVREGAGARGGGLSTDALVGVGLVAVALAAGVALYRRDRAGTAGGGDGDAAADDAGSGDGEEPPEELLSNEEKVLKLVRERGGRVKQQEVVEAFDWTEAKTSQVVRDLREQGDLEGFRLGRENVLRLPEEGEDGDS